MDAAAIEEINKVRIANGMQPLPVPGAEGPKFRNKTPSDDGEEPASTLETREAAAYDNFKKIQDAEEAKKRREEKAAAIKKARDAAKRVETLQGKGLGEADESGDLDAKAWLMSQKKRQKRIEKARKLEEELAAAEAAAAAAVQYTSKDLAGVKVSHEVSAFEDGDEQILTLKDTNVIGDEDEGDELENINLREREKLESRLELKKKKPVYDPYATDETGERNILAQYDEEISGKKKKKFTLDVEGITAEIDSAVGQVQSRKAQKIHLDILKDDRPSSDYLDISEVKIKKPKKKKSKSTRQRPVDEDDVFPIEPAAQDDSMDIDSGAGMVSKKRKITDANFVDDEDLQATLAIQRREALKKRKRTRPEDIARQLKEESEMPELDTGINDSQQGGLVIDEISEFASQLKRREDSEERKPRKSKTPNPEPVTTMGDDSDEDEQMKDGYEMDDEDRHRETSTPTDFAGAGVDEETSIGTGIGSTLKLLRDRNILKENAGAELNENLRARAAFLAEKRRRESAIEQEARRQRERERMSGKLDRMSTREREEWARQQNNIRDQQTSRQMAELFNKSYKPNVELKYVDDNGRHLDKKEAWKMLSHAFHGKTSGKGKMDKALKKQEDERRREAQPILDASQNVGMSSATAQQSAKQKQAGVRLA